MISPAEERAWLAGLLEGEGAFWAAHGPHQPLNPTHKPYWTVSLGAKDAVLALSRTLYPLMGSRRQAQLDKLIAACEKPVRPYTRPARRTTASEVP